MTIAFPNPSRSFDVNRNGVRFVGHDGVFGIPFIVMASARRTRHILTDADVARA